MIPTRLALLFSGVLIGIGVRTLFDVLREQFNPKKCKACSIKNAKINELERRLHHDPR